MPRLIVNADDFGLTSGVNRAILELHQAGVLTSATLMAHAAATPEAIDIALATQTLGVGCHVVLVDGEPILSATNSIPDISSGVQQRFKPTLECFLSAIYLPGKRSSVESEIEAEARAQIQSLQSRGLRLTHIDTHKHTHMFPRVLRPLLRAARSCGIRAIRNPFEPSWSVRATPAAPIMRRVQVRALRALQSTFLRLVAQEDLITTNGALGVLATGKLDKVAINSLLPALSSADGTYELVTHPGYYDAELAHSNTRLLASRDIEREALVALRSPADPARMPQLISFAKL